MPAPAKFTFDLNLEPRGQRGTSPADQDRAVQLGEARAAAFAAGRAEGMTEGENSAAALSAREIATAATMLSDRVAAMVATIDDYRKSTLAEAVELSAAIGRKLAGTLLAREPAAEIEALIVECLASLDGVPHLVIRCHPDLAEAVREIATARMTTSGFTGRLVVMGEPEHSLGDCRIEWVDGGLVRDSAAIGAEIDNRIAAFMAARHIQHGGHDAGEIE